MLARNLQKFKLITFDSTNTILYFKVQPSEMYLKTAVEMGHKMENFDPKVDMLESFKKNFKSLKKDHPNFGTDSIGYEKWWTHLVINVLSEASCNKIHKDELEKVANRLIKKYETEECWGKFDKVDELIGALKRLGKAVGVISNFDPRLHTLLNRMELYDFNFVITSYEAKVEKPNLEIFQNALAQGSKSVFHPDFLEDFGISPWEALHIGNEIESDIEGAKNAGWSSVLIGEKGKFSSIGKFYEALNSKVLDL